MNFCLNRATEGALRLFGDDSDINNDNNSYDFSFEMFAIVSTVPDNYLWMRKNKYSASTPESENSPGGRVDLSLHGRNAKN